MTLVHGKTTMTGYGVVLLLGLLGGTCAWWMPPVLLFNPSPSLPYGVYLRALTVRPVRVDDLVVLETPESLKASLPPGYEDKPLLKQVAGLAGMTVCWGAERMTVGRRHATPLWYAYHPEQAVRYEEGCQTLSVEEMLIVGRNARSFDSRYIGPVSARLLRFRVWPLWTWEAS